MSATTSCSPCTEPGGVSTIPVPKAIEHAEPGGVSCTKRISSLTGQALAALDSAELDRDARAVLLELADAATRRAV